MKLYTVQLTMIELRALRDAADRMRDDFEDYHSYMGPKRVQKFGGKSLKTKNARSVSPLGFCYAFYNANS